VRHRCAEKAASDGAIRSLGVGVVRWQVAYTNDTASNMSLDGLSPCCLYRAVAYQRSGIAGAVKRLICTEGVFAQCPVRVPPCRPA
jgi:hypothetical protein